MLAYNIQILGHELQLISQNKICNVSMTSYPMNYNEGLTENVLK